jgi:hypothetical protein
VSKDIGAYISDLSFLKGKWVSEKWASCSSKEKSD